MGNGCLGGHCELIIGSTWLLPVCGVNSGSWGVMNHMEVPFVTGLSVTGLCSTSDSEWYKGCAVEGSGYGGMDLGGAVYTLLIKP
jgi:hypothetical protein